MLVSVVIPTYGYPKLLRLAIDSVLTQTLLDIQLIIVDDNNPDTEERKKTEELVTSILKSDSRMIYIKHENNKNGAVARNTGLTKATGKYIALLDNDDEYMPERLEKCYKLMEKAPERVGGVYTGCEFRKRGKTYHVEQTVKAGNFIIDTLATSFMFCTGSNLFLRKSVVDELNGFDESFLRHQDYEFLVRFFEKYSMAAISEVLVIKNDENLNIPSVEKLIDIKKQYLSKFKYLIDNLSDRDKNYVYHTQYISVAEIALRNKLFDISRVFYKKSKKYGALTIMEKYRKIVFTLLNLLCLKWN